MNTKNSTKRQLCCCLVEFLVFNSICRLKSDLTKTLNREEYDVICGWPLSDLSLPMAELNTKTLTNGSNCCRLVEFLVLNSIDYKKRDSFSST